MIKFLIVFFFILTNSSFSQVKKVNIIGNSRVNSNTIESLVDKKITNIDSIYINNLTKKIYDTEFFAEVFVQPLPTPTRWFGGEFDFELPSTLKAIL